MLTIDRPSPQDDSWYRLPHTVEMTGTLPPGIKLIQQRNPWDLPQIQGTPTEAGTFTVQFRAVMEDGLSTSTATVTFTVKDPRETKLQPSLIPRRGVEGTPGPLGHIQFRLQSSRRSITVAPDLVKVEADGLPDGVQLKASQRRQDPPFSLVGTAKSGSYPYVLRFQWADGQPLGETTGNLEILPADALEQYSMTVWLQEARAGRENSSGVAIYLQNATGTTVNTVKNSPILFEMSGLPEGLTYDPQSNSLRGTPRGAGVYRIAISAKDSAGKLLAQSHQDLTVQEAVSASAAAGTYDTLIDRSEPNGNNGGRLIVSVTRTGNITGFLLYKFQKYPFSSKNARFKDGAFRISPPNSGVLIEGFLEESGLAESSDGETNVPLFFLEGKITRGDDWLGSVSGKRAAARPANNPSPFASSERVNLIFVRDPWSSPDQPAGTGFLSYYVKPSGVVTGTYWGADGSAPVSVATRIIHTVEGGYFPLYLVTQNDSGKGSLSAQLFLNARGDSAGHGSFYQPATNKGSFPDGISLINYTGVIGSRYAAQPDNLNTLGLEEGMQNAELELEGAELDEDITVPVTVTGKSTVITGTPTQKVATVQAKLDKKTGLVIGKMELMNEASGRKSVTFRAMVNPAGGAVGHFTLKGTTKRVKAGSISLAPKSK
jgi:hypothetical protein